MMNLITVVIVLGTPALCLGYLIYRVRQLTRFEAWARTLYQSSTLYPSSASDYLEACFYSLQRPSSSIEVPQEFHDAFRDVEVIEP